MNKNTKQKRKAEEKSNKRGVALNTTLRGKHSGDRYPGMRPDEQERYRKQCAKFYGKL